MPRFHENIVICGRAQDGCVNEVTEGIRIKSNQSFACDCFNGCWAINYKTALSIAKLFRRSPLVNRTGLTISNLSVLHAYFKDSYIQSQKKEEYIGFTEFLCK